MLSMRNTSICIKRKCGASRAARRCASMGLLGTSKQPGTSVQSASCRRRPRPTSEAERPAQGARHAVACEKPQLEQGQEILVRVLPKGDTILLHDQPQGHSGAPSGGQSRRRGRFLICTYDIFPQSGLKANSNLLWQATKPSVCPRKNRPHQAHL